MDMDLTPEQELLADSVRRSCERHAGSDVIRKLENDSIGYPPALWSQLGELGVLGLVVDEEYGGSGMTILDSAIVYQELGRALAPTPQQSSCVIAAGVLRRAAPTVLQDTWLPRIATGESIVAVAWLEPDGGFGPNGVQTQATRAGDGWVLRGRKRHVGYARAADALLTLARTEAGVGAFLVDPNATGVRLDQQLTVAGDTQYAVTFDDVQVGADRLVSADGWDAWQETMLDAAILVAAQAVGGAKAALDLTVDYAKKREQFDRPLGGFQAIAHYLADATTRVDGAETLAWEAAWSRTQGRSVRTLAPMAKLYACQTFRDVTAMAQQVFGGNGFTVDFDIQLYFRRAKSLQLNWWGDRHLEQMIAGELLTVP